MKQDYFIELKNACKQREQSTDEENLKIGSTVWITGIPESSLSGTVALRFGTNQILIIAEKDILEVDKADRLYFVKIRVGANLISKIEIISEVRPTIKCTCHDNKEPSPHPPSVAKRIGAFNPNNPCEPDCWVEWNCMPWTDSNGFVRIVCFPYPVCKTCPWA